LRSSVLLTLLWIAYLALLAGGIATHVLYGRTPETLSWTAPICLLLAAAIAVVSAPSWWRMMAIAAAIGFAAEMIGVHTGFPFGHYRFTSALGPQIFGMPIVVPAAWLILFAYVSQMRVPPPLAAGWVAAIELVIDPTAANDLGYWEWLQPGPYYGVPVVNFLGWFAVSLIIFYVARQPPPRSSSIQMLGRAALFFFSAIAAAHHYFFPAFLGVALAAAGYWRFKSSNVSTIT
jgi:putative membrane protein